MKFAIDRYAVGTEKEVSADEFDNKPYIHSLNDRLNATSVLMVAQNSQ